MATKTFSSRADEAGLAYADSVARKQFGMSFGQYCGSVLIDAIKEGAKLPEPESREATDRKASAILKIKTLASNPHDEAIGRMTDDQINELIASRYA